MNEEIISKIHEVEQTLKQATKQLKQKTGANVATALICDAELQMSNLKKFIGFNPPVSGQFIYVCGLCGEGCNKLYGGVVQ